MKKQSSVKKTRLVLGIVMSSLVMVTLGVSSFAYWQNDSIEVTIPTYEFNATENEFTYYACVPNVAADHGYDYYDLDSIPEDLVDRVTGLAVVRYEALTKTAYIPPYPKVTVGGTRFNYNGDELPVIHILSALGTNNTTVSNGFKHVETLIIPNTVTFVQEGAFYVDSNDPNNKSSLREVSILGKEENSGHIWYFDDQTTNEFNGIKPYFESAHRHTQQNIYELNTPGSFTHTQFNDEFEYDNITGTYYTYVITGNENVSGTNLIYEVKEENRVYYGLNQTLDSNSKYRIDLSFKEETPTVTAKKYTYELSYIDAGTLRELPLVLNTNVNYEEYILNTEMNVIRMNSYPVIEVVEKIDGEETEIKDQFDLNKLNAYYSEDNAVFDIKYAPSYVYESIHYRGVEEDLVEEKTMTQIGVEKAYFLNKVVSKELDIDGEIITTVSVKNNDYIGLYVKAGFDTNSDGVVDTNYLDPTQNSEIIKMELVNSKYQFEFRGSNNPIDPNSQVEQTKINKNKSPDEYLFYLGKYNVLKTPDYIVNDKTASEVETGLLDVNAETRRIYLELNHPDNVGKHANGDDKLIDADRKGNWRWYVVYWIGEVRYSFEVFYTDSSSTILIADIPSDADKFKFVRVGKDVVLDKVLVGDWTEVTNQNAGDLTLSDKNLYKFDSWGYNGYFNVSNDSILPIDYLSQRVYLELGLDNDSKNMVEDDHNGLYNWYAIYWTNNYKNQYTIKAHYLPDNGDVKSTILYADIPTNSISFKFVRISSSTTIDLALQNGWSGVVDQNDLNIEMDETHNLYQVSGWASNGRFNVIKKNYDDEQIGINEYANNEIKFGTKNQNYLIMTNYGDMNNTERYITLDENLGYGDKELEKSDGNLLYKLEFSKYDSYLSKGIQKIALPKGTIIEAKLENFTNLDQQVYFDRISPSSLENVTIDNDKGTKLTNSQYFNIVNGKLVVIKDMVAEIYLRPTYFEDPTKTTLSSYHFHFVLKNNVSNGKFDNYDLNRTVISEAKESFDQSATDKVTLEYREPGSVSYPLLEAEGSVVKLERNYANKEFEEYKYSSENGLDGEYVISPYYETNRSFGANTGSVYYGLINPNSPSGELDLTTENLVMFTPNGESSYDKKYYAAFDDYNNFLTFLSFNRTQTINEGYQVLSAVIPQALSDFQNIKIYEVDSKGNILDESKVLNSQTNLNDLLLQYNENTFENEGDYIEYGSSELLFDYFMREKVGASDDLKFYTNNIGFTKSEDDNGDKLYYYNNVKISLSETRGSSNSYQITTSTNRTTPQKIANNEYPLDEQIIDGYYYNGICTDGSGSNHTSIRFLKTLTDASLSNGNTVFKDGYYDFVLRVRNGKLYLGYKYLGTESVEYQNYYLHMYSGDDLISINKMYSMNNGNHYYIDISYNGIIDKIEVYNDQKVCVYRETNEYTFNSDNISRFYYGVNTPIKEQANLYRVELGTITVNFNFGSLPKKENDDSIINTKYSPVSYISQKDYYEVKVQVATANEKYYVSMDEELYLMKKHQDSYSAYVVNPGFNKEVNIYLNENIIKNGEGEDLKVILTQPGKYQIFYNSSTGIFSSSKVQEPDMFYLYVDEKIVAELEVNPNTTEYYEYIVEDYIVLENGLKFVKENEEDKSNNVEIRDVYGNVVALIEKVTCDGESTTSVDAGAYSLTYSVDSSRRVNDKYHVFTYLNFTTVESNTVTYHYQVTGADEYTKVTQIVASDRNWMFDIFDLNSVKKYYTPVGKFFVGWSTDQETDEVMYKVGEQYSTETDLKLYPVFDDLSVRHKVIWIKAPDFDSSGLAIFSLTNLDNTIITDVSYSGYDEYVDKYVTIDKNEGNRVVTVDQSLFEVIGYVHGGIKLVCHLLDDYDKTSTCTVTVNYPNYDNREPFESKYSSQFTSSEYDAVTNVKTGIINSKDGKALSWDVVNGAIVTTNPTGESDIENNYSLRLRTKTNDDAKATILSVFQNIKKINLSLYFYTGVSSTNLTINILDLDKSIVVYSESFTGKNNKKEVPVSWNVPSLEGRYYIQFVASSTDDSNVYVHIDNLSIITGASSYSTSFSSNEYSNMGSYTTTEKLISGNTENALSWTLYHSRFTYNNADNGGTEDKSNLALAIEYEFDANKNEVLGYARLEYGFTSISNISFTSYQDEGTIKLKISILKKQNDGSYTEFDSHVFDSTTEKTYKAYTYDPNCTNGEYYVQFSVVNNGGLNSTNLRIDNLEITL